MRRKIGLYLGAGSESGGMFQYGQCMLEAVSALPRDKFEVLVAYSSKQWSPYLGNRDIETDYFHRSFFDLATASAWRRSGLPVSSWRRLAKAMHPLSRKLIEAACQLWIFPFQDTWSYRVPVRALAAIHDLMHRYEPRFPEVSAKGQFRYREAHYRNICRWSTAVLVDSTVGKEQVHESYGLDPARIHVLPFAPPKYIYAKDTPPDFDEIYRLPPKFAFYPARFWAHKNHLALVRGAKTVVETAPDFKLVFVGSKKNGYDAVKGLVRELGLAESVIFLGHVPDNHMPELYRRARCMVMPTFFGPTNIPPLEAFATGCPAAVSNIYGMPEQIGEAALFFDPVSDAEISGALLRLWTDDALCEELSARGLTRLAQRDQDCFNQRLLSILRGLA
jgi:glycosyltransferase involved in cell wall biosynthesis